MLSCRIELPENFRIQDVLEFHGRDSQQFAERVTGRELHKGLIWTGHSACLTLRFREHIVETELAIDGPESATDIDMLNTMVRRMLGLTQAVEEFEHHHGKHPELGPLIARQRGLRVPLAASPFEALAWAVTGQQISLGAAVSLRRKLIHAAGLRHSSGLACYPDAAQISTLKIEDLRRGGFSQSKAQTLITLSRLVETDALPLQTWLVKMPPIEQICEQLLRLHGIGPWTVSYALLRGFGWLDGSLHGDAGVRRGLQNLLLKPEKISDEQARAWLEPFSPWRALVAAHLWASNATADIP
jgi:DNA-3-methyladenine glycosylase II